MPIVLLILGVAGVAYLFTHSAINTAAAAATSQEASNSVGQTSYHVFKQNDTLFQRMDGKGATWTVSVPDIQYKDRFDIGNKWQRNSDGRKMTLKPDGNVYAMAIIKTDLAGKTTEDYIDNIGPYNDQDWDYGKVTGDMNAQGLPTDQWNKTPKAIAEGQMINNLITAQKTFDDAAYAKSQNDAILAQQAVNAANKAKNDAALAALKAKGNLNISNVGGVLVDTTQAVNTANSNAKAVGGMFSGN